MVSYFQGEEWLVVLFPVFLSPSPAQSLFEFFAQKETLEKQEARFSSTTPWANNILMIFREKKGEGSIHRWTRELKVNYQTQISFALKVLTRIRQS